MESHFEFLYTAQHHGYGGDMFTLETGLRQFLGAGLL
jgi:hypothetical protein